MSDEKTVNDQPGEADRDASPAAEWQRRADALVDLRPLELRWLRQRTCELLGEPPYGELQERVDELEQLLATASASARELDDENELLREAFYESQLVHEVARGDEHVDVRVPRRTWLRLRAWRAIDRTSGRPRRHGAPFKTVKRESLERLKQLLVDQAPVEGKFETSKAWRAYQEAVAEVEAMLNGEQPGAAGTFTITLGGRTTEPIAYDASVEEVGAAAARSGLSWPFVEASEVDPYEGLSTTTIRRGVDAALDELQRRAGEGGQS